MKEKWIADFSKPERSCFIIKPEISFDANLDKGALFLGLKKKNRFAWLETADRVYVDQVIEARFRLDSLGGYGAAGIMFRIMEGGTYYLALVSSKGYFRLDAVHNNVPRPLVGWTESPGADGCNTSLEIIVHDDHFIFILNGRWIAEAHDASIPGGHLGFALFCYDSNQDEKEDHTCLSWLDWLSVDSRFSAVEAEYHKWRSSVEISAESRIRLAESHAALERFGAAYDQILRAWKQREDAARSVSATYTEMRAREELLFAARMAVKLEQYEAALEFIEACPVSGADGTGDTEVFAEKAKILNAQSKYAELAEFLYGCIRGLDTKQEGLHSLYALLGHACWNLQDYKSAAEAWDRAFILDKDNGLYAVSAANAFEALGKKKEARKRRLDGGKCFVQKKDRAELEALIPKLLAGVRSPDRELSAFLQAARQLLPGNRELNAIPAAAVQSAVKTEAAKIRTKQDTVVKKTAGKKNAVKPQTAKTAEAPRAKPSAAVRKPAEHKPAVKIKIAKTAKVPPKPAKKIEDIKPAIKAKGKPVKTKK